MVLAHAQIINQSINQSNFYSANIPGVARLSGATARSVFKYKVVEAIPSHQQTVGRTGVYGGGGEAKSKRYVWRRLLKVATEVAEWTDSGRLFQREGAQELKAFAPVLVLILGTDRVIPLLDLSESDGKEMAIKERR